MYIAEKKMTVQDATVWCERNSHGNWVPIDNKCVDFIKWFHDGVLSKADPGMFRMAFLLLQNIAFLST